VAGINKVILIGNLGRDPELRYTQGGSAVCNLSVATTRSYMKGEGKGAEKVEETEWHKVVVWGKTAEFCNQYLAKGRQCYVEGRLQTRSYEDKDGIKRYSTDIVAETVQFLGGRAGDGERPQSRGNDDMDQSNWGGRPNAGKRSGGGRSSGRQPGQDNPDAGGFDNYIPSEKDDDIPFD
jgi:single-strand DNA-binding protein